MQSGFFQGSNNPVTSANCSNTVCDGVAGMDFRVRLARKCDPSRVLQFLSQLWYKDVSNKVPLKRICVGVRAALRRHTSDRASKRQGLGPRSTNFMSEPTIKLLYPCHRTCKMESPLDLSSSTNGCAKACGQRFSHKAREKHCPINFAVPRLQGVIHCTVLSWSFGYRFFFALEARPPSAGRGPRAAGRGTRDAGRGPRDRGRGTRDAGRGTRAAGRVRRLQAAGRGPRDAGRGTQVRRRPA